MCGDGLTREDPLGISRFSTESHHGRRRCGFSISLYDTEKAPTPPHRVYYTQNVYSIYTNFIYNEGNML